MSALRLLVRALVLAAASFAAADCAPVRLVRHHTSTGRPFAEQVPDAPVEALAKVAPGFYRSGQPVWGEFAKLREMGFRTVVSLRQLHDWEEDAVAAGLEYHRIPLRANWIGDPPTDEQVEAFFRIVLDPAKQPVLIYCSRGRDRTGLFVALWRIEVEGWTPDEAAEEMRAFGGHDFYDELYGFVSRYESRGFVRAFGALSEEPPTEPREQLVR